MRFSFCCDPKEQMLNLPKVSIKYYVSGIMRKLLLQIGIFSYNLQPNPQKGFAILPLIVLLLIGIAGGTYLIQNGVNFLPKAQEQWSHPKDDPIIKVKFENVCYTDASGQRKRNFQIRGRNFDNQLTGDCDRNDRPCFPGFNTICQGIDQTCQIINPLEAQCISSTATTQAAPAAAPATTTSSGNQPPAPAKACKDDELLKNRKDPKSGELCSSGTKCLINSLGTRTCLPSDFPTEGQPCPQKITDNCAPYEGQKKQCLVIGELPRCRYPDSANNENGKSGCKGADSSACFTGEECWIYNDTSKGTYKYSACRKTGTAPEAAALAAGAQSPARPATGAAPAPAAQPASQARPQNASVNIPTTPVEVAKKACSEDWMNTHCTQKENTFCNEVDGKARCAYPESATKCNSNDDKCGAGDECVLVPFKVSGDSKTYKYSICKSVYRGASSSSSATGATTTSSTTPSEIFCGTDDKGVKIPCYAMGVFSPEELKTREFQAQIASVNYAKFRKIIDDQEAKIGAEIATAARNKIAAAEEAMKACIK